MSKTADSDSDQLIPSPWSNHSDEDSIQGYPHQQLWEMIQRTEQEIKRQKLLIDLIEAQFRQSILPKEYQLSSSLHELTSRLIVIFNSENLTQAQTSLLGLWITENLETLVKHPFANPSQMIQLQQTWQDTLNPTLPLDTQLLKLFDERVSSLPGYHYQYVEPDINTTFDHSFDESEELNDDDIVFDFGWHKKDKPSRSKSHSGHHETGQRSTNQDNENHTQSKPRNKKLKHLSENLSVERLFRKLAKVLHPDKELDESLKQKKHELMSQCLDARQKEDIHTLITLYCEYVGELPEALKDDSDEELLNALKIQLQHLRQELSTMRYKSSLEKPVIDRYYANDENQITQQFQIHVASLDNEIKRIQQFIKSVGNTTGLSEALLRRKEIEFDRMTIADLTGSAKH